MDVKVGQKEKGEEEEVEEESQVEKGRTVYVRVCVC